MGFKAETMEDYKQIIHSAKPGQIVPIVKQMDMAEPVDFFAKLSDYGRAKNCCLFESREYLKGSGALSFGTARPALYLTGTGAEFTIKALSKTGRRIVGYLSGDGEKRFSFCESVEFSAETITGRIKQDEKLVDEQTRLQCTNQMDVLRAVAFAFSLASKPFRVTCGLLGAISYDFIDQFEKLPPNGEDLLGNPDYELYFADNIFLCDHEHNRGYVIVNCVITDDDREAAYAEAQECFDYYCEVARSKVPEVQKFTGSVAAASTDTAQAEYEKMVRTAKQHILDGDILQVVLSRTKLEPCADEPLDVYKRLRKLNPSPYMFYLNTPNAILMGSSPELNLRVSGTETQDVEIRPIAGTKPRGRVGERIDPDTDFRYEAELKLDHKELAEHIMLVDLARNDIARVAEPGSRIVTELLITEKYASVQHLVSNVKGTLANNLDALSAYLATMNMGTLTGAPKIEAMKIIRQLERTKRGYYGGAVMYLTVDGQFDSCITIRSLQVKDHVAYIRVGAGIVHDSVPKTEFEETEHKANSCVRAIRGQ
ncbi:MAG: anthranilate synthase component 1 [Planctomycetota bacterium]|nr:MAG: anthranilate synthase component 1 [Planctomycetota bacterium]